MKNNCKSRLNFGSVNLDFGSEIKFIFLRCYKFSGGSNLKKVEIQVSEGILLRDAINDDINDYLAVPFNEELLKMYGSSMDHRTKKSKEKVANMIEEIKNNPFEWVIDYNGKFIGQASLKLEKEDNKARYAIGIFNPNYWSKAIGSNVTKSLLEYAFNNLDLHKVYLRVLDYNLRAIKSYKKVGFIEEGRDREGALINKQYCTDIYMGILKKDYK